MTTPRDWLDVPPPSADGDPFVYDPVTWRGVCHGLLLGALAWLALLTGVMLVGGL